MGDEKDRRPRQNKRQPTYTYIVFTITLKSHELDGLQAIFIVYVVL